MGSVLLHAKGTAKGLAGLPAVRCKPIEPSSKSWLHKHRGVVDEQIGGALSYAGFLPELDTKILTA
jgi:hypothetical protein